MLKLNVGASRKVGDNNYGSRGASVNLEMELDASLLQEPARLQERIRDLFGLVRKSLAEELNGGNGNGHNGDNSSARASTSINNTVPSNGNGAQEGNGRRTSAPRAATQSQVKALFAIARSQGQDLHQLLRDRFHIGSPDQLSIREASQLIDDLKGTAGREGG